MSNIHPSLEALAVDIATLTPDPRNARLHSDRNLRSIMKSLEAHGQRKPIVVQRTADEDIIRAGNGTVEAATRLGWDKVAAVIVEESDEEAIAFAIRDNRTAELAEWDYGILAEELGGIADLVHSMEDFGFDEVEMAGLRMASYWDDLHSDDSTNGMQPKEKLLIVKFTEAQVAELRGIFGEEKVTADAILKALKR